MGILLQKKTERRVALGSRNLAGRGSLARIVVDDGTVSAEHASIYFDGQVWKVRELGSRNGTKVNGERIADGASLALDVGDRLVFGGADVEWELEDENAPGPAARCGDSERVRGKDGVLWLPDDEQALASVSFRDGGWVFENGENEQPVVDGDPVVVGGGKWALELPLWDQRDANTGVFTTRHHGDVPQLQFVVSQDYEHIELHAEWRGHRYDLGARAHNLPLLILAKNRIKDRDSGLVESEAGWTYVDALMGQTGLDRKSLNLQLWRSVRSAKRGGFPTHSFIERRVDAGQLRILTNDLNITDR